MLEGFFEIIFDLIKDLVVNFFDVVINILSILPGSPFVNALEAVSEFEFLGYMNYFIPFQAMATVLNLWLTAVLAYYVYRYVRKYTDYIERIVSLVRG